VVTVVNGEEEGKEEAEEEEDEEEEEKGKEEGGCGAYGAEPGGAEERGWPLPCPTATVELDASVTGL
jgi:hypothetical protein